MVSNIYLIRLPWESIIDELQPAAINCTGKLLQLYSLDFNPYAVDPSSQCAGTHCLGPQFGCSLVDAILFAP